MPLMKRLKSVCFDSVLVMNEAAVVTVLISRNGDHDVAVDQPVPKLSTQETDGAGLSSPTRSYLAHHSWLIGLLFKRPPSQNLNIGDGGVPYLTSGKYVGAADVARAATLMDICESPS